jgi:4-hydroxyphenylacetate 3-monooxygenase
VFLSAHVELHNHLLRDTGFLSQIGHQILTRQVAKTTVMLGVAQLLSTTIGISGFLHVQAKLGEIITTLEALRSCLRRAEVDATPALGGVFVPQGDAIQAGQRLFAALHPRLIEILQLLGAGGYMMTPSEADMHGPMSQAIANYYQGAGVAAYERIQLFRLAWDVVGDSFASRQQLNEREFSGDPVYLMAAQYREYDTSAAVSKVRALLGHIDVREPQT